MKTSDLTGPALDWAVAKCQGMRIELDHQYTEGRCFTGWWQCGPKHWQPLCNYSTDWAQGGPIIEREEINIVGEFGSWLAGICNAPDDGLASPTPLIAAMRCYVVSKLGDEIEIPEEKFE